MIENNQIFYYIAKSVKNPDQSCELILKANQNHTYKDKIRLIVRWPKCKAMTMIYMIYNSPSSLIIYMIARLPQTWPIIISKHKRVQKAGTKLFPQWDWSATKWLCLPERTWFW